MSDAYETWLDGEIQRLRGESLRCTALSDRATADGYGSIGKAFATAALAWTDACETLMSARDKYRELRT